jgi:hypothetical protein
VKLKENIENYSFWKITKIYLLTMLITLIISIVFFFFPVMPICYLLGIEFSNLGPIATAAWGIIFNLLIVTPVFICVIFLKLKYTFRH